MPVPLIDTHAHLDEEAFDSDRDDVIRRAGEAGIETVVTIGTTAKSSTAAVELAKRNSSLRAAVGIQPNYVAEATDEDWTSIERLVADPVVVAVGETGLDRYWDYSPFDLQVEYFRRHIALARRHDLPFVVHCREAEADVVAELRQAAENGRLKGVMHSYSGDEQTARQCLELGMHISFSGMLTYKKNEALRQVATGIPLNRLLVETDAPYLAPVPKRGKRNEPALIVHTAHCLADLHQIPLQELAAQTTANATALFDL
ncbi:MAG: TatD family hydrolase [Planctomycetes bacterium]|nr:TatD family hydrolase [Planctomycetota bacterium]